MASKMENNQGAKITLYWLNKSRSQRILWLLEELNVDYEVKVYKRDKDMRAPPELKEIHPLGKSPVVIVEVPGEKAIVLAESGLITEYLIDHFGPQLAPKRYPEGKDGKVGCETEAWLRYRYYLHFAEGSLMPPMLICLIAGMIKKAPVPFFLKFVINGVAGKIEGFALPEVQKLHELLESQLASAPDGGPFICGKNLTGADIILSFPLEAGRTRTGLTKEKYPKLSAYIDMLQETDGYKRGVQKIIEIDGSYDGMAM